MWSAAAVAMLPFSQHSIKASSLLRDHRPQGQGLHCPAQTNMPHAPGWQITDAPSGPRTCPSKARCSTNTSCTMGQWWGFMRVCSNESVCWLTYDTRHVQMPAKCTFNISATNGKSLRLVASEMGFQPLMKQKLIQMEFTEVKRWYA